MRRCACGLGYTLIALLLLTPAARAEWTPTMSFDGVWQAADAGAVTRGAAEAWIRPQAYSAVTLDRAMLWAVLAGAPLEGSDGARSAPAEIELPMPDGSYARFRFVESPVMAPELAAEFPEIRTFLGQGIDDPDAVVRFDITPQGFHAQILSPAGAIYIDPLNRDDDVAHASYYKRDYKPTGEAPRCTLLPNPEGRIEPQGGGDFLRTAETLRTYRLANAATREYTQYHGGTVTLGQAAIVTAINRVTGVYEVDLGIRMVLVANNSLLVYTSTSDPYSNNDGVSMLSQNISTCNSVIGSSNYDIGHVFSTGGGGVAYRGVVCTSSKAGGVTGQPAPINDPFYIDYVAHEMGHQFGANHSFNSQTGSCGGGNRNSGTAYEPGSGSTIMAYAGICGSDNLQSNSDPYFHHDSFREIRAYITSGSGRLCPTSTSTGNGDPVVNAGANYTIPRSTPFELTASATDPNGDPLTFCWEERDLGAAQALSAGDNGTSPLFRSWNPTTNPTRTFPRLSNLLANTTPTGERLPTTNRTLNFRCTARDNRAGGGGVGYDDMFITVTTTSGPFTVTAPNTSSVHWSGTATVTWNVASTTASPVLAANVDILLSIDGGNTFPIVLAANTPNDGSQVVTVPNTPTSTARVKVRGSGNIFFDISNANFTIDPPPLAISVVGGAPSTVTPGVPTVMQVQVTSGSQTPVPGSAMISYRLDGGSFQSVALTPLGGTLYEAVLPRAICTDTPQFYLSVQGNLGATAYDPSGAPAAYYAPNVGPLGGPCPAVGDGDFDSDGDVDLWDFAQMQGCWGEVGLTPVCEPGDMDGSDAIDHVDLDVFIQLQTAPVP